MTIALLVNCNILPRICSSTPQQHSLSLISAFTEICIRFLGATKALNRWHSASKMTVAHLLWCTKNQDALGPIIMVLCLLFCQKFKIYLFKLLKVFVPVAKNTHFIKLPSIFVKNMTVAHLQKKNLRCRRPPPHGLMPGHFIFFSNSSLCNILLYNVLFAH